MKRWGQCAMAGLVWAILMGSAPMAQAWKSMSAVGTFNNWNVSDANMLEITSHVWMATLRLTATNRAAFKFAADASWANQWGETNQAGFALPVAGQAEPNGNDVVLSNVTAGAHVFRFDDNTRVYSVARYESSWRSMTIVASFNSFNFTPNMTLITNHLWYGRIFLGATNKVEFRVAADRALDNYWGQSGLIFKPPYAGVLTSKSGLISMTNVNAGFYEFTFNETNLWLSITNTTPYPYATGFRGIAAVGTWNNWDLTPNLTLISNYTWQANLFVQAQNNCEFKFAANGDWSYGNWGLNGQGDYVFPITGTVASGGANIKFPNTGAWNNYYRFTFNERTLAFSLAPVYTSTYQCLTVAGFMENWNTWPPNMVLVSNNLWRATVTIYDDTHHFIKYVPNNDWAQQRGDTNQALLELPIQGYSTPASGESGAIEVQGTPDGKLSVFYDSASSLYQVFPEGYVQTFDTWPDTGNIYRSYEHEGWMVYSGRVTTAYAEDHPGRFYRYVTLAPNTNMWFRTPCLTNGIKSISFWYANWNGSINIDLAIEISTNAVDWTKIDGIYNISSTTYTRYYLETNILQDVYVRIRNTAGKLQLVMDDLVLGRPFADVDINQVTRTPPAAVSNDTVYVSALVSTNVFVTNVNLTLFYRVGSNSPYSSIEMPGTTNYFTSSSGIPPQPSGTRVEYYIRALYDGSGDCAPVYWPDTAPQTPAWYGISKIPWGQVWVNEVNPEQDGWLEPETNEFIELCGQAGTDIAGWRVIMLDTEYVTYGDYIITNNYYLPADDPAGFGFFVLGDAGVPRVDMIFTNPPESESHLESSGGILLYDELGVLQYALCYGMFGTNLPGMEYIGEDPMFTFDYTSLGLHHAGSNYASFAWATNTEITAGIVNQGQSLTNGNRAPVPLISCADLAYALSNQVPAWTATITNVVASGACGDFTVDVIFVNETSSGGGCPTDPLVIRRRYRAISDCNTSNETVQTITVADTLAPVITNFPGDATVGALPDPDKTKVQAWDNAGTNGLQVLWIGDDPSQITTYPATVLRTYQAKDRCDNATNRVQTFTVTGSGPIPDIEIQYVRITATNMTVRSTWTNGNVGPEFATSLRLQNWAPVVSFSNIFLGGTNTTVFALPSTSSLVIIRIDQQP